MHPDIACQMLVTLLNMPKRIVLRQEFLEHTGDYGYAFSNALLPSSDWQWFLVQCGVQGVVMDDTAWQTVCLQARAVMQAAVEMV